MDQQIRNKIQTIVANLGTNTGFIQKIRSELTSISQKLQQVLQSRASLQKIQEQNKQEVDVAKKALAASQLKVTEISNTLRTATADSARQLQQLQGQIQQEKQLAQQRISASEAKMKETSDAIASLDQQLNQISQVVQTQTSLLNEANSGDQNNLFNHINGINQILQNILAGGPVGPPPPSQQFQTPYPPGLVVPNQQYARAALVNQQYGAPPGLPTRFPPGRGGKKMRKSRRVKKTIKKRRRNTRRQRK